MNIIMSFVFSIMNIDLSLNEHYYVICSNCHVIVKLIGFVFLHVFFGSAVTR